MIRCYLYNKTVHIFNLIELFIEEIFSKKSILNGINSDYRLFFIVKV